METTIILYETGDLSDIRAGLSSDPQKVLFILYLSECITPEEVPDRTDQKFEEIVNSFYVFYRHDGNGSVPV